VQSGGGDESDKGQETQQTAGPSSGPQRYFLHVLFFGLALSAALGAGVRGVQGSALTESFVEGPSTVVAAYLKPPAMPETLPGLVMPEDPSADEADGEAEQADVSVDSDSAAEAPDVALPEAVEPTPSPDPTPIPSPDVPPVRPTFFAYTTEPGDSLTSLSLNFGLCPDHLLWANPGVDALGVLPADHRLLIPAAPGILHYVRPGDTIADLASLYNVDTQTIAETNGLTSSESDIQGMLLLLPGAFPPSVLQVDFIPPPPSPSGFVWPWIGDITSFYGEPRLGYVHLALDIAGLEHWGAPVASAAAGYVAFAVEQDLGLGNYVIVQHDDGSRAVYAHLFQIYVQQDQRVDQGQALGALGCSGHSFGTHLHFELWVNGIPVDPLDYLPLAPAAG
jgi:hypothetical protein